MKTYLQRGLSFVLLLAGLGLMLLLSLALIFWLLIGTDFAPLEQWLCEQNITTECVVKNAQAKVDAAQASAQAAFEAVAAKEAELADLETQRAELQGLHDRFEQIELRASSYSIFHEAWYRGYKIQTGHGYGSLLESEVARDAWCYTTFGPGNDQNIVYLARFQRNEGITNEAFPEALLAEQRLSPQDVDAMRSKCIWPEVG